MTGNIVYNVDEPDNQLKDIPFSWKCLLIFADYRYMPGEIEM